MNSEKLSQLLRDQSAINALSLDELDKLIEAYPYLQQLREIKAYKLEGGESSQGLQHEAAFYRSGWSEGEVQDHELIDLGIAIDEINRIEEEQIEEVELEVGKDETEDLDSSENVDQQLQEDATKEETSKPSQDEPRELSASVILEEDIDAFTNPLDENVEEFSSIQIEEPLTEEVVEQEQAEIVEEEESLDEELTLDEEESSPLPVEETGRAPEVNDSDLSNKENIGDEELASMVEQNKSIEEYFEREEKNSDLIYAKKETGKQLTSLDELTQMP